MSNTQKERMNFAKMMERQEQQIIGNSYVHEITKSTISQDKNNTTKTSNLIGPEHLENLKSSLKEELDYQNNQSLDKIKQLEATLQEVYTKIEKINYNPIIENKIIPEISVKKMQMTLMSSKAIGLSFALGVIITALLTFPMTTSKSEPKIKTIVKEKIVTKNIEYNQVITKFVNLREKASGSGRKLAILNPGFLMKLNSQKNDWYNITYKDTITGKTITGWIYGKNFTNSKLLP